ncbi:MAG: TIGR04013 family B12-binding domain/radical SAM domain-containing protein [Thermoproteus sp.]
MLIVRELPGARNGLAYALSPVEDLVKTVVAKSYEELLEAARRAERPLVLYGLSTPAFVEYWREVADVAARYPVVVGGPQAIGDPLVLLRLGVKYVVIGDGEAALPAIIERELNGASAAPPNTLFLEGERVKAGPRVYVDLDRYRTYSKALDAYPPIEIMRGCPYRCSFCLTWRLSPVRYRSVDSVAEMVRAYVKRGLADIRFVAPVGFLYGSKDGRTVDVAVLVQLLEAVRREGGRPFLGTFPSETRPETVTDEVLRSIKGLVANRKISFGLQTGSKRLLELSKRGHDVETAIQAAETARRHGFMAIVDIITGLPGEEEEDVDATVAAMERLVKLGAKIRLHYFIPLPGTPLWGLEPAPFSDKYRKFVARYRPYVEGYWEEQIELSAKIRSAYREVLRYLSLTSPNSSAIFKYQ